MKTSLLPLILCLLTLTATANDCFVGEYYDNNLGSCQQCDLSCATCSSSLGCTSCYTQMYLTSRGNSVLCDLCYNIVKNCQICISANKCKSCSNGYLLDSNNVCQSCSTQIDNCLFCYQNATLLECLVCNVTYTLVGGTCLSQEQLEANAAQNPPASQAGNNQGQGSSQGQGSAAGGATSIGAGSSSQTNSQVSASSAVTSQCESNEVQIEGVCIIEIPFCLEYNTVIKKCKECAPTFILNLLGYCIPEMLMMGGAQGRNAGGNGGVGGVSGVNNGNSANSANSANNNRNDGSQGGEGEKVGSQVAKDCKKEQYLWWGWCVTFGTECTSRNQQDQCTGCITGFRLDEKKGICHQIPPPQVKKLSQPSPAPAKLTPVPPTDPSISTDCAKGRSCLTCRSSARQYCLTCIQGYTTVDVFPGNCFAL